MRPTRHETMMNVALSMADRSTCSRRKVGCVLTNHFGHIVGTGYNGVPRGGPHCTDVPCEGAYAASGTKLSLCSAIHAEANAMLQCPDTSTIVNCYCTTEPCVECTKLLLNTGCINVFFGVNYSQGDASENLWKRYRPNGMFQRLNLEGRPGLLSHSMNWASNEGNFL